MIRHRFLVLLILLSLLLVVHPIAIRVGTAHTLMRMLTASVFGVAMWNVFRSRRARALGLLLGIPVIAGRWMSLSNPSLADTWVPFAFNLATALFLGYCVVMILAAVYAESHLTREAIYGALCGFLLIGAAFGHLFYCLEWLVPEDYQVAATPTQMHNEREKEALYMYYSYAALTGMSDPEVSPRNEAGRSLVLAEAVLGQFYIIVVLSELISLRVSRVPARLEA
ncbi:MAG TPA: hypothetical protein VMF30_09500 [Pirellulales bacterium]|nr:hypothetical protein [Pirellulales bacterium]